MLTEDDLIRIVMENAQGGESEVPPSEPPPPEPEEEEAQGQQEGGEAPATEEGVKEENVSTDNQSLSEDKNQQETPPDATNKPQEEEKLPKDAKAGETVREKELTYWVRLLDFSQFKNAQKRYAITDYFSSMMPVTEGDFQNPNKWKLRVRQIDDKSGRDRFELTIKVGKDYRDRQENTTLINKEAFELFGGVLNSYTHKQRYEFEDENGTWYVDLFPNGKQGFYNWAQVELEYTGDMQQVPNPPIKFEELLMPEGFDNKHTPQERDAKYKEITKTIHNYETRNPKLPPLGTPVQDAETPLQDGEGQPMDENGKLGTEDISADEAQKEQNEQVMGKEGEEGDNADTGGPDATEEGTQGEAQDDGAADGSSEGEEPPSDSEGDGASEEVPAEAQKEDTTTTESDEEAGAVTESLTLLTNLLGKMKHIHSINGYLSQSERVAVTEALAKYAGNQNSLGYAVTENMNDEDGLTTAQFTEEAVDKLGIGVSSLLVKLLSLVQEALDEAKSKAVPLDNTDPNHATDSFHFKWLDSIKNEIQLTGENQYQVQASSMASISLLNAILADMVRTHNGVSHWRLHTHVALLKGMSEMLRRTSVHSDAKPEEFEAAFADFAKIYKEQLLPKNCTHEQSTPVREVHTLAFGNNHISYIMHKDPKGLPHHIEIKDLFVAQKALEGIVMDLGSSEDLRQTYDQNDMQRVKVGEFMANASEVLTNSLLQLSSDIRDVSDKAANASSTQTGDGIYWLSRTLLLTKSLLNLINTELSIIRFAMKSTDNAAKNLGHLIQESIYQRRG